MTNVEQEIKELQQQFSRNYKFVRREQILRERISLDLPAGQCYNRSIDLRSRLRLCGSCSNSTPDNKDALFCVECICISMDSMLRRGEDEGPLKRRGAATKRLKTHAVTTASRI